MSIDIPWPRRLMSAALTLVLLSIGWSGTTDNAGASHKSGEPPDSVTVIPVTGHPRAIAAGPDRVWVANTAAHRTWAVSAIDPATNEVEGTVLTRGWVHDLALASEKLWVLAERTDNRLELFSIDRASGLITGRRYLMQGLTNAGSLYLAAAEDYVWVARGGTRLVRVDLVTEEKQKFSLSSYFNTPFRMDVGGLALDGPWAFFAAVNGKILRLDAYTGAVQEVARTGWNVSGLDSSNGRLWLGHARPTGFHRVLQLDASDLSIVGDPIRFGRYGPSPQVAASPNVAWAARFIHSGFEEGGAWVLQIDPATNEHTRYMVDIESYFSGIDASPDGTLWIADPADSPRVLRISP